MNIDNPPNLANYADLTTAQTVTGNKTFSSKILVASNINDNSLVIAPTGNTGVSSSSGGAINLDMTNATGSGFVAYSNRATSTAPLFSVRTNQDTFDQHAIFVDYKGNTNALNIKNTTPSASNVSSSAVNITSDNENGSAMQIRGSERQLGSLKATHQNPSTTSGTYDANAATISVDIVENPNSPGVGTAAQGIVVNSTTGTTGMLFRARNLGVDRWAVEASGNSNFFNNRLINIATPTAGTDAVNKAYVDSGTTTLTNKTLTTPILNEYLEFNEATTLPPTPGADKVRMYIRDVNGLSALEAITSTGTRFRFLRDQLYFARNESGVTIPKGSAVYISSVFTGGDIIPVVSLARANSTTTMGCDGIAGTDILNNNFGRVYTDGRIEDINTSAFTLGDKIYVSETTAGALTNVMPVHPNLPQLVARITRVGTSNGSIQVTLRGVGGESLGTRQNTFTLGDTTAGNKTLAFSGTAVGSLQWNPTAARTLTLPDATDTLVGRATTDTLTNKTLAGAIVAASSFIQISGAFRNGVNPTRTAAATLSTTTAQITLCDATTAAFSITLPATTTPGITFTIKKIDSSANAVTVLGNIDGATNYVLTTQYKHVTLITTATSGVFYIISNN